MLGSLEQLTLDDENYLVKIRSTDGRVTEEETVGFSVEDSAAVLTHHVTLYPAGGPITHQDWTERCALRVGRTAGEVQYEWVFANLRDVVPSRWQLSARGTRALAVVQSRPQPTSPEELQDAILALWEAYGPRTNFGVIPERVVLQLANGEFLMRSPRRGQKNLWTTADPSAALVSNGTWGASRIREQLLESGVEAELVPTVALDTRRP